MRLLLLLLAAAALLLQAEARAESLRVTVDGTRLVLTAADGSVLPPDRLPGTVIALGAAGLPVRIDSVEVSNRDPDVTLYNLSSRGADGTWTNVCPVGIDGTQRLMALSGKWTADGRHVAAADEFNLTCTAGAIGKCVLWGYKPWLSEAMWQLHQACVRMTRADYCGDGTPHTRNGTKIDIWDRLGIQRPDRPADLSFEAAWGPDGAVCVAHTRIPEIVRTEDLAQQCPNRLAGRVGPVCSEKTAPRFGASVILNGS